MGKGASRSIAALMLAALVAIPGTGIARIDPECGRGGKPIFAEFEQPKNGQLLVHTQATGPIALDAAGNAIAVSTTGTIPVVVHVSCIMELTVTVTKNDPVAGPQPVFTHTWDDQAINGPDDIPVCVEADVSVEVPIGMDGGQYDLVLTGTGCNGGGLTPRGQGAVVGDPPLGI